MKTIFWNVDTQKDFMRDDESFKGALAIPGARGIEGNLGVLTRLAGARGIQVVNTADWHTPDDAELSDEPDFDNTFPPHCLAETEGAGYVLATQPEDPYKIDWRQETFDREEVLGRRNLILYKNRFDVFAGNPHTGAVVDAINPDRVIVYGVATNVCVDCAVQGLLERGVEVYVPTDAIKELPNRPLPLDGWVKKGAKLITTDRVEEYI